MHPLLPNTITLVIRFLDPVPQNFAHQDFRDTVRFRDGLVGALKSLAEVNNLAREQVCEMTADAFFTQNTPPELEMT
jgi:hypothetical protein